MRSNMLALLCAVLWIPAAALALTIETPLPDAAAEARARELFKGMRCMVCQSESVADSPAEVARDMRRFIREDVAAGVTDEQIKANLVVRYGEAVLMSPPLSERTLLLWAGPWVVLALGGILVAVFFRRSASPGTPEGEA
jgi:cytochrome c-type biogenesis protein CcmH